jgi:hypothetical protein
MVLAREYIVVIEMPNFKSYARCPIIILLAYIKLPASISLVGLITYCHRWYLHGSFQKVCGMALESP